ncbi:MAG: lysoplasmalogenase [Deltaproteobacteria bacterium]|nr:lysoplasmalogenase [Deltaproteobacteria bacterium]
MINTIIVLAAVLLLIVLLYCVKKQATRTTLIAKSTLSVMFMFAALVQSHPEPTFYYLILAGLIFCLMGDVFLALPQKKMFTMGLAAFLAGHVFYIISFLSLIGIDQWVSGPPLVVIGVSAAVLVWLWPHLDNMRLPVLFYVVVITVMVAGAWAVYRYSSCTLNGPLLILAGAVLFYLSDLFVAIDRFVKERFINRLIGLPLYYLGQFMLAFSVGLAA